MSNRGLVPKAELLIREWIKASSLKPGGRLPSERALAKELGIPYYSVNRAMAVLVSQGLVERQKYKLFFAEALPDQPETFSCDVVVGRRSAYIRTFKKVAREVNARISLHFWDSNEEAISILKQLSPTQTQGVLFSPPAVVSSAGWEQAAQRLTQHGVPFVSVGQRSATVSSVSSDNERALETIVTHLSELGHRELAFTALSPWTLSSSLTLAQWNWLCQKYRMPASAKRVIKTSETRLLPEEVRKVGLRLKNEWKGVTALIVADHGHVAQHLLDELARNEIRVPEDLSLIFLGDNKILQTASPSISATSVDEALLHEAAYLLLKRAQRTKAERGLLPQQRTLYVVSDLIIRQSTGPAPGTSKVRRARNIAPAPSFSSPLTAERKVSPDAENAWRKPYALAMRTPQERFLPLDLQPFVNRPLAYRRGWLGDLPLKNLPSGERTIHGVPFQILGGNSRTDCGAVVFRSLVNTTGNAQKLPELLQIPVSQKVAAVYVLHGCGYAQFLNRFAVYSFFSGRKKIGEVPMVSLGNPDPDIKPEKLREAVEQSNIQDWWSDHQHYDFPQARTAPILEQVEAESVQRHSYLYTLEWINPSPHKPLTRIEIASDPNQSTTLGVLAISLLTA